jgi:hypothetical protein
MKTERDTNMALSILEIALKAKEQLIVLTGLKAGTVSGLHHDENGWHIVADMVELKRIPESADILATYEATLDDKGNLVNYQRTRRYSRGDAAN